MDEPKGSQESSGAMETPDTDFQRIADTVGLLPSARMSENVFQAKFIGFTTLICVLLLGGVGLAVERSMQAIVYALVGLLIGLVGGTLISGAIIGYRNLRR